MQIRPEQFDLNPTSGVPIYRQLMDQVAALLVGGQVQPGDMLPSVRDLGGALGVNMMTVSKAYARLEVEGLVERARGKGMLIRAPQANGSLAERTTELKPLLEQTVVRARQLGLSDDQIQALMKRILKQLPERG